MRRRPEPDPVGPGQESVWDYPRPPRLERSQRHVVVELDGAVIAETGAALRVLETSNPPVYYLPMADFAAGVLQSNPRRTFCEFKGWAAYHDVRAPAAGTDRIEVAAGWSYPEPTPGFEELAGHVALYPARMDRCTVDGEIVRAVQGDFYGGWVTDEVVGPFKGEVAGSQWW
ncbi:MAG TPA: DUF427 domain-containing protein [Nitriliruptoraceae bacterium]|nr:DUF427 domain-containing protein [Nitriliruptoraceae bacterium]